MREYDSDNKVQQRIVLAAEQMPLLIQALAYLLTKEQASQVAETLAQIASSKKS